MELSLHNFRLTVEALFQDDWFSKMAFKILFNSNTLQKHRNSIQSTKRLSSLLVLLHYCKFKILLFVTMTDKRVSQLATNKLHSPLVRGIR